jgi:hypothetical protein
MKERWGSQDTDGDYIQITRVYLADRKTLPKRRGLMPFKVSFRGRCRKVLKTIKYRPYPIINETGRCHLSNNQSFGISFAQTVLTPGLLR